MQPSEYEIQREVETLRDIRRRSSAQGSILDPDLPAVSSDSGSSTGYWEDSSSSSHGDDTDSTSVSGDDPFSPFWVPARLHPEIAPAEFRAFLKDHARAPADGAPLERASSIGASSLGRKKSMLSRQYNPSEKDGVEEEQVVPLRRNRTSMFTNQGPQLTISDLQKLEQLAEEASQSSDPSKLRSVLRRSISLNIAPSVIDQMDDMPDLGDDADSPIIVPRPGQILRRAARTKIRKAGTADGPHRFTSARSRRGSATRAATTGDRTSRDRTSSDVSSSDHSDEPLRKLRPDSDVPEIAFTTRPESYSEEASIYDAYAREDDEPEPQAPLLVKSPESPEFSVPVAAPSLPLQPLQPQPPEPVYELVAELHHPQPQRLLSPPLPESAAPQRTPSPEAAPSPVSESPSTPRPPLAHQPASHQTIPVPSPSPSPSDNRKEKDKKGGLFGKWGGDKGSKKAHHQHQTSKEKEKEKDGSFFGSLFGGKKKQEDSAPPMGGLGNAGRETAVALLGSSKSAKSYAPSPSPQPVQGYARYPIHVERAIYRLSHIKLANPRRPLYEQVLISNLMFWYLGVINKGPSPANQNGPTGQTPVNGTDEKEREQAEKEKEREEREKAERERAEKEREKEKEKERNADSKRKGSLTKSPAPGAPRRAEMAVRGPQYDMQHRAMEQEYGYSGGNSGRSSAPPGSTGHTRTGGSAPAPYQSVQLVQPQPHAPQNRYYTPPGAPSGPGQGYPTNQQLPPGAMPPVNVEQSWMNSQTSPVSVSPPSTSPPPRTTSPPSAMNPRRTKSPPAGQRYSPAQEKQPFSGGRTPGRSLSASATPPVQQPRQTNGAVLRKGTSAHAVLAHRDPSEEEDIPLAMYHQQRRK